MALLEESDLINPPPLEEVDDENYVTDNESIFSQDDPLNETFYERIIALKDAIPFQFIKQVNDSIYQTLKFSKKVVSTVGSGLWVITTGATILLLPLAMEVEKEHAAIQQEVQMLAQQQQAQQVIEAGKKA